MAEFNLRSEEGSGVGEYHVQAVYDKDVTKGDYCIVEKKDYPDVILKIKVNDACDLVLDSVAANRSVPEEGVDTFIAVDETIASFSAAGEEVLTLSTRLAKLWALNFPYLNFRFTESVKIDFIVCCCTAQMKLDLKSELNLGVKDLTINAGEILYIAGNDTVAVNKLTNKNLIRVDGKLIARKIYNGGRIDNKGIVEIWS